ncbi:hypothetical protein HGRIS_004861 [Hohenbuehelia grisea]
MGSIDILDSSPETLSSKAPPRRLPKPSAAARPPAPTQPTTPAKSSRPSTTQPSTSGQQSITAFLPATQSSAPKPVPRPRPRPKYRKSAPTGSSQGLASGQKEIPGFKTLDDGTLELLDDDDDVVPPKATASITHSMAVTAPHLSSRPEQAEPTIKSSPSKADAVDLRGLEDALLLSTNHPDPEPPANDDDEADMNAHSNPEPDPEPVANDLDFDVTSMDIHSSPEPMVGLDTTEDSAPFATRMASAPVSSPIPDPGVASALDIRDAEGTAERLEASLPMVPDEDRNSAVAGSPDMMLVSTDSTPERELPPVDTIDTHPSPVKPPEMDATEARSSPARSPAMDTTEAQPLPARPPVMDTMLPQSPLARPPAVDTTSPQPSPARSPAMDTISPQPSLVRPPVMYTPSPQPSLARSPAMDTTSPQPSPARPPSTGTTSPQPSPDTAEIPLVESPSRTSTPPQPRPPIRSLDDLRKMRKMAMQGTLKPASPLSQSVHPNSPTGSTGLLRLSFSPPKPSVSAPPFGAQSPTPLYGFQLGKGVITSPLMSIRANSPAAPTRVSSSPFMSPVSTMMEPSSPTLPPQSTPGRSSIPRTEVSPANPLAFHLESETSSQNQSPVVNPDGSEILSNVQRAPSADPAAPVVDDDDDYPLEYVDWDDVEPAEEVRADGISGQQEIVAQESQDRTTPDPSISLDVPLSPAVEETKETIQHIDPIGTESSGDVIGETDLEAARLGDPADAFEESSLTTTGQDAAVASGDVHDTDPVVDGPRSRVPSGASTPAADDPAVAAVDDPEDDPQLPGATDASPQIGRVGLPQSAIVDAAADDAALAVGELTLGAISDASGMDGTEPLSDIDDSDPDDDDPLALAPNAELPRMRPRHTQPRKRVVSPSLNDLLKDDLDLFGDDFEDALIPGDLAESRHASSGASSPLPTFDDLDEEMLGSEDPGRPVVKMLSWKDWVAERSAFEPEYFHARDLPNTLHDHINAMDDWSRSLESMRTVFEMAIHENTAKEEPHASPITVFNDVDNDPCPPWEFYYSNQMWHGDGVPAPTIEGLEGCDCYPKCLPNKKCKCFMRQRKTTADYTPGFVYDERGRAVQDDLPIFECNDLCRCDDDCRNRVVQNGRKCDIKIGKTRRKGWGVFAGCKIPKGTFIGLYSGELITEEAAEQRGLLYNKSGRTYLFDLDFFHLRDKNNEDWSPKYVVDAYHVGNFTRFLNHSCSPNSKLVACYINESDMEKPLLTIFSSRDIKEGEEVCFSYSGAADDDEDTAGAPKKDAIYVVCRCGARNCTGVMFK